MVEENIRKIKMIETLNQQNNFTWVAGRTTKERKDTYYLQGGRYSQQMPRIKVNVIPALLLL